MKRVIPLLPFVVLALSATGIAAAALSGKWTIDGDVQGNPVNLTCDVQQIQRQARLNPSGFAQAQSRRQVMQVTAMHAKRSGGGRPVAAASLDR